MSEQTKPAPGPVLVGIPALESVYTEAVVAVHRLRLPPGSEVVYTRGGCTIAAKRLALAERFVGEERFETLLFLDSDMAPPPHAVAQLLKHELPIVGALYFTRRAPFRACAGHYCSDGRPVYLSHAGGSQPVQRVEWIGTGCLLIRREAFLKIPEPWFGQPDDAPPTEGEDIFFCRQAARAQVPVYCDTGLCVGHLTVTSVDLDYVAVWQDTRQGRRACRS